MRKVNLKSMFLALFLLHIILVSSITATSGSYTVVIPSFSQHGSLLQGKKSSATDFTATHFISGMGGNYHELFTWVDRYNSNTSNWEALTDRPMCIEMMTCNIYYNIRPLVETSLRARGHIPDFFAPNVEVRGTFNFK